MSPAVQVAHRFAAALDAHDWAAAEACLEHDCAYSFRGTTSMGAAEIIASYRTIGDWVAASFERVRYESEVVERDATRAEIRFRDLIDHGEYHLDFRCNQILRVGARGSVVHIEHVDIAGEPEKVQRFNAACGVEKPGVDADRVD